MGSNKKKESRGQDSCGPPLHMYAWLTSSTDETGWQTGTRWSSRWVSPGGRSRPFVLRSASPLWSQAGPVAPLTPSTRPRRSALQTDVKRDELQGNRRQTGLTSWSNQSGSENGKERKERCVHAPTHGCKRAIEERTAGWVSLVMSVCWYVTNVLLRV